MNKLGVIGGSGLYEIEGLTDVREVEVETPFGKPSDLFTVGMLEGTEVTFLPRHGRGHHLMPTELPFKANLYAMKKLGMDQIMAISAVGSMREEIVPGHLVVVDQFIDRTRHRSETFFGDGIVGHVHFADPIYMPLAERIYKAACAAGATVHEGGTYLCMEGPQFSTRAESHLYRSWGVKVIGMTNLQEAKLAREAGMGYSTLALATDYDCWHETEDDVSVDAVIKVLKDNAAMAKDVVRQLARSLATDPCPIMDNPLEHAILSSPEAITQEARERLAIMLPDRFLS
jgi:5'-methylthioadenosine phosphorylase